MGVATAVPCQSRFFFGTFPERFASRPRQTTKPFRKDLKNAANRHTKRHTLRDNNISPGCTDLEFADDVVVLSEMLEILILSLKIMYY